MKCLLEEANKLVKIIADALQLQAAWQSRDLIATPRLLAETSQKLDGFPLPVPEVELVVKAAEAWRIEAQTLEDDLKR